jgi:hypothetical protein
MAATRGLLRALGVLSFMLMGSLGRAEQASTIKISFVLVYDIIGLSAVKQHHAGYSATVTLGGRNEIGENWQAANVAGERQYHSARSELGKTWRVLSANTIQGAWRMPNYTKTVTIRVAGKTCSVVWDTQLDPGEAHYKSREGYSHTKPKMIDPVCTVER